MYSCIGVSLTKGVKCKLTVDIQRREEVVTRTVTVSGVKL